MDNKEQFTEASSNVAHTNWTEHKESTSPFGIKLILLMYRIGGKFLVYPILYIIVFFVYLFNKNARLYSKTYLDLLSKNCHDNKVKKYSCYKHLFRFCESVLQKLLAWNNEIKIEEIVSVDNALERMRQAATREKGGVLISAHVGNIEMMRAFNTKLVDKKIHVLLLTSNSKKFFNVINSLDNNSSIGIIAVDEITPAVSMELEEYVNRGDWVCIMADRVLQNDTRSIEVDFLGEKANFPQGPWILAHLLKAPIYTVYITDVKGKYHLYYNDWGEITLNRKTRNEDIAKYVNKFTNEIALVLENSPYDWFNIYDFWGKYKNSKAVDK